MPEAHKPLPPLRPRFHEPFHPDELPDVWACACGEPVEVDQATCAKCRTRAQQRAVDACALCGRDTDRADGVCPRCAADPVLYRDWSEPRSR